MNGNRSLREVKRWPEWTNPIWLVICATLSIAAIWLAITQPDSNKALDFWAGAVVYILSVSMSGYWLAATLDS